MSGKLFKIKHDEATNCTLEWLKRKVVRDFGCEKMRRILEEAGIKPVCHAKGSDGVTRAVYNLRYALDAINAYRRSINCPKKENLGWFDRIIKQTANELAQENREKLKAELTAMAESEGDSASVIGLAVARARLAAARANQRTHMEYKPFPYSKTVSTEEQ